jgi:hypothetical protein
MAKTSDAGKPIQYNSKISDFAPGGKYGSLSGPDANGGYTTVNPNASRPSQYSSPIGPGLGVTPRASTPKPSSLAAASAPPLPPSNQPDYAAAFQQGLDSARGSISQQLNGALSDIANSQRQAGVALGQYAPMINNDWRENTASNAGALAAVAGANTAAGVGGNLNNGALGGARLTGGTGQLLRGEMAPDVAATNATHREDLSDQSLLATGISQQAEHERALANLAAQSDYGQLAQAQMGYQATMAGNQQQNANALYMAQLGQYYNQQNQATAAKDNLAQARAQGGGQAASGPYATYGLQQSDVSSVQKNPAYSRWNLFIGSGGADPNQVSRALAGQPKMLQVLMAENPGFFGITAGAATAKP